MKFMGFLEFVTDEDVLRAMYDHFRKSVNQLQREEYYKRGTFFNKTIEEFESRLDELADEQPYGTHCGTFTWSRSDIEGKYLDHSFDATSGGE